MNNAVDYIFGSLRNSEQAIQEIVKCLKMQTKFNKRVAFFAITTGLNLYVHATKIKALHARIDELQKELEELKFETEEMHETKGE